MLHKLVDCRELLSESPFGPVFYLRRDLVVPPGVEVGEKGVYLSRYTDTAILLKHGRGTIRNVAGTRTHNVMQQPD